MTPERILLNIHLSVRSRMDKATLPMGASRTKWINDAIAEKLDREHPDTIGAVPFEPVKAINPMEILAQARRAAIPLDYVGPYTLTHRGTSAWKLAVAEHKKRTRKGESIGLEAVMEGIAIRSKLELSDEEKDSIMEAHKLEKAAAVKESKMEDYSEIPEDVKGHPVKYREWDAKRQAFLAGQAVETPQDDGERMMQMEGLAPAAASDADFWGDDEADKVRALIKRHAR